MDGDAPAHGIDLLDDLLTFVDRLPLWCRDGKPVSWRHYCYGMAYLGRAALRDTTRQAEAARVGQASSDEWKSFLRDIEHLTATPLRESNG